MSQPLSGSQKPVIAQNGDTLTLKDRGDWFVQEGPERPPRTAIQWERQLGGGGWELVSVAAPLNTRTPWELREAAEVFQEDGRWTGSLKIGPENANRKFRALVAAGMGPSPGGEGDRNLYCEWGSRWGDHSGRLTYSNELVVAPWGAPPPPPPEDPPEPSEDELVSAARLACRQLVLYLRREGFTWAAVKEHPFGHAYYKDLGGR